MLDRFGIYFCAICTVLLMSTVGVYAQSNPNEINVNSLTDTPIQVTLNSIQQIAPHSFDNGYATYAAGPANDQYTLTIHPNAGFTGEITAVVTYYSRTSLPPLFMASMTTTINATFGDAVVLSEDDYVTVDSSTVYINPLDNDSSSVGGLQLSSIVHVESGTASIVDSVTIAYDVPANGSNLDYILYASADSLGGSGHGIIYVVTPETNPDSHTTETSTIGNTEAQIIRLPDYGMVPTSTPVLGSIDEKAGGLIYKYFPTQNATGVDSLMFDDGSGLTRQVIITINDYITAPLVVEDEVFTAVNTPVTFDAWANDNFTGNVVLDWHSAEIVRDSLGVFTFSPPLDFTGIVNYSYIVDNGFGLHEANVRIYVGDQAPRDEAYAFTTPKDESLVLRYDVESSGYTLDVQTDPDHGFAMAFGSTSVVSVGCDNVSGKAFIVYTPDAGFIGVDSMTVRYCTVSGACVDYVVEVEVYDDTNTDCKCLQDCVWAGDTDLDGRVNVRDILPIAYALGEGGDARSDISYSKWEGQSSDDWDLVTSTGINYKHIDADGDGTIDVADASLITSQYSDVHTLVPTDLLDLKKYPLSLIPHNTNVDSGDLLVVDIVLGNSSFPVENLQGFALGFNINPGFADSSSLVIDFLNDSWFASNGPTLEMSVTPRDGRVEAAFGKANGFNANGFGVVGQLSFIVEDDAEGLRENIYTQTRQIKIATEDQIITDGAGRAFRLPAAQTSVTLHLDRDLQPLKQSDLIVYPNPVDTDLRLHLNGGRTFTSVQVYDMMGSLLLSEEVGDSNGHTVDVSYLQPSVYVVEVVTADGLVATKFVKH
jgi:hypothetical protein